jgi:flagellar biosynthesis protein
MTDKTKKAAALKYRHRIDPAPSVVASGRGIIAERIIEIARNHNIPLKRDPALIEVLSQLDIDREIPPELYQAVAEILAYVYRTWSQACNITSSRPGATDNDGTTLADHEQS